MPINALELWNASTLDPADLGGIKDEEGELIIGLDDTEEQQFAAAVAWVATEILPIASAEDACRASHDELRQMLTGEERERRQPVRRCCRAVDG